MSAWNVHEHIVPRKAAACILFDEAHGEVLMVRRNPALAFMGGHYAFPGGALDPADDPGFVEGVADTELAKRAFAVVREVFEETGLLLSRGPKPELEALRAARGQLHIGKTNFASILRQFGHRIHGEDFAPAGLWITPPFSPIRFDTQYFLYRFSGERHEEILDTDSEIVELTWARPEEVRRHWHEGALRISTPVSFVLRHLGALPVADALPWLRQTPSAVMDASTRFELRPGIFIIPVPSPTLPPATHTNCAVIGESELYVVDPGGAGADEQTRLKAHLDHLIALGGRIKAVLLTHGHADHTGGVEYLRAAYQAPVWGHKDAAIGASLRIDRELQDGEMLRVQGVPEWRIRCLHTPGHHPGHCCYLEESTKTLAGGDMLANPGTILVSPLDGGDMTQYLASLERLLGEDYTCIVPAHGTPLWGDAAKEAVQHLIAHRLAREEKIRAVLTAGARTVAEVLERAYDDTPRAAWPLAEQQLQAHLVRLHVTLESE